MGTANKETERKLGLFEQEIMGSAQQICKEIDDELEAYRASEMGRYKDDALAETSQMIQSELSELVAEGTRELSRKKMELKKRLYVKRDDYTKEIFSEARRRLEEFAKSDRYPDFLYDKVKKLLSGRDVQGARLLVRQDDMRLEPELKKLCGAVELAADDTIRLGGARLVNEAKNYIADETLDNALEEQKEWFAANSGFIVTL